MGVYVDPAVEEPPQSDGILEVQLVVDHGLEARLVEQVEERRVRLLARVVERVLVARRVTLEEEPDEREVAALHGIEQRGHPALAAPLDRVAVRVRAGVEQQFRAAANVRRRAGRPAQQHEQRRQPVGGGGRSRRVGPHERRECRRVGKHERAPDGVW